MKNGGAWDECEQDRKAPGQSRVLASSVTHFPDGLWIETGAGSCASGEPVPAPQVAAKASQVLLSFRLDSPEGAELLERAEVS